MGFMVISPPYHHIQVGSIKRSLTLSFKGSLWSASAKELNFAAGAMNIRNLSVFNYNLI